jgi:hypothetical protein
VLTRGGTHSILCIPVSTRHPPGFPPHVCLNFWQRGKFLEPFLCLLFLCSKPSTDPKILAVSPVAWLPCAPRGLSPSSVTRVNVWKAPGNPRLSCSCSQESQTVSVIVSVFNVSILCCFTDCTQCSHCWRQKVTSHSSKAKRSSLSYYFVNVCLCVS